MATRIFISYSTRDKDYAVELQKHLKALGDIELWRDVEKMPAGTEPYPEVLEKAAKEAQVMIALISADQIGRAHV